MTYCDSQINMNGNCVPELAFLDVCDLSGTVEEIEKVICENEDCEPALCPFCQSRHKTHCHKNRVNDEKTH